MLIQLPLTPVDRHAQHAVVTLTLQRCQEPLKGPLFMRRSWPPPWWFAGSPPNTPGVSPSPPTTWRGATRSITPGSKWRRRSPTSRHSASRTFWKAASTSSACLLKMKRGSVLRCRASSPSSRIGLQVVGFAVQAD